jgi:protoheme IX farnesyltransferase
MSWTGLLHTLSGTALLACAASALNQWWERGTDALMPRTRRRPLPEGRLSPGTVLAGGVFAAIGGLVYLGWKVNPVTSVLGALSITVYLFLYTPLKRRTWLNTMIGSVAGALPPLMAWTGGSGEIGAGGVALFAILVCWQLPHFMAIAWIYREEYAAAGLCMLPVVDRSGRRTGAQAVLFACLLVPVSMSPWVLGVAGVGYLGVALALGLWMVRFAIAFRHDPTVVTARRLFRVSVWHLSWLLVAMMADKIR